MAPLALVAQRVTNPEGAGAADGGAAQPLGNGPSLGQETAIWALLKPVPLPPNDILSGALGEVQGALALHGWDPPATLLLSWLA